MLNSIQRTFPDSCPFTTCGSFPGKKNKEDLKTYGYTTNETMMNEIQTDDQWNRKIGRYPPPTDEAKYVQLVRGFTYEKPWDR